MEFKNVVFNAARDGKLSKLKVRNGVKDLSVSSSSIPAEVAAMISLGLFN